MASKRTSWTVDEMVKAVNVACERHDRYVLVKGRRTAVIFYENEGGVQITINCNPPISTHQLQLSRRLQYFPDCLTLLKLRAFLADDGSSWKLIKKRCRKTVEFWSEVGLLVGHSGEQTERLFKNLASDYQRLKQLSHVSGAATESPILRGSEELFHAFESYYLLYFPHGGSTLPGLVLTEGSITLFNNTKPMPTAATSATLSASTSTTSSTPLSTSSTSSPSSVLPTTSTTSSTSSALPVILSAPTILSSSSSNVNILNVRSKFRSVKRGKSIKRSPDVSIADMVKLQMRQLNVERQRLNVERQKLAALQGIEAHMKFIRCDIMAVRVAVCHSTGIEVVVSDNKEE